MYYLLLVTYYGDDWNETIKGVCKNKEEVISEKSRIENESEKVCGIERVEIEIHETTIEGLYDVLTVSEFLDEFPDAHIVFQ